MKKLRALQNKVSDEVKAGFYFGLVMSVILLVMAVKDGGLAALDNVGF